MLVDNFNCRTKDDEREQKTCQNTRRGRISVL